MVLRASPNRFLSPISEDVLGHGTMCYSSIRRMLPSSPTRLAYGAAADALASGRSTTMFRL